MILGEKVVLRPNRFRFLKLLSLSKCLTILIIFSAKLRTQIWVKCVSQFYRKYGYLELIGFSKSWLWNSDLVTGLVFLILFISQFPSSIVSISINSISAILFIASYQISHGLLNKKSIRPIHLYLIFEKSSLTNWIFAGYTDSKNPVRNRIKIQFVKLDFSNMIFQKSSKDG